MGDNNGTLRFLLILFLKISSTHISWVCARTSLQLICVFTAAGRIDMKERKKNKTYFSYRKRFIIAIANDEILHFRPYMACDYRLNLSTEL